MKILEGHAGIGSTDRQSDIRQRATYDKGLHIQQRATFGPLRRFFAHHLSIRQPKVDEMKILLSVAAVWATVAGVRAQTTPADCRDANTPGEYIRLSTETSPQTPDSRLSHSV